VTAATIRAKLARYGRDGIEPGDILVPLNNGEIAPEHVVAELGELLIGRGVGRRDALDEVQRRLREVAGVTAIVYDQECAAEKRRLRKRGKRVDPPMRVFIDEANDDPVRRMHQFLLETSVGWIGSGVLAAVAALAGEGQEWLYVAPFFVLMGGLNLYVMMKRDDARREG